MNILKIFRRYVKNYKGKDPYEDSRYFEIQRRYAKRKNKLMEDAYEVEQRHLNGLVDELSKEFLITKEEVWSVMEEFGGTTEDLYFDIMQKCGFRKPNKKKVIELMRYQHGV